MRLAPIFLIWITFFVSAYGSEQFVYHASPVKGLKELSPQISTHGKSWVYATKYIGIVAAYLGGEILILDKVHVEKIQRFT